MATKSEFVHLVDKILLNKLISEEHWELLIELIHADGELSEEEKMQLSRIHQLVSEGEIQIQSARDAKTKH